MKKLLMLGVLMGAISMVNCTATVDVCGDYVCDASEDEYSCATDCAADLQPDTFGTPMYPIFGSSNNYFSGSVYNAGNADAYNVRVDIMCSSNSTISTADTYTAVFYMDVPAGSYGYFYEYAYVALACDKNLYNPAGYFGYILNDDDWIIESNYYNNTYDPGIAYYW
ncbi:MAG: hypothetical protein OEZ13_00755 [Spirochaetia bacterium]|nr:hypothetical protein [Spirochaetia bacterium]